MSKKKKKENPEKKDIKIEDIEEILKKAEEAAKEASEGEDLSDKETDKESEKEGEEELAKEDEIIDPIVAAEEKAAEANNKYLRLMAEFDNFKKRTAMEYGKMVDSANKNLMVDIIEVRETLQKAVNPDEAHDDFESFKEGISMIFNKLEDNLKKHGLESFGEVGDAFDPSLHDAMMKQASEEVAEDCLLQVFERGYKLKDNIIKHAKVIVSEG
jgi:molecular chaperone GrpE